MSEESSEARFREYGESRFRLPGMAVLLAVVAAVVAFQQPTLIDGVVAFVVTFGVWYGLSVGIAEAWTWLRKRRAG